MAKTASLPFKGSFTHSQGLGANPGRYARYGLSGHDGDDWLMPEGTSLFAPVSGQIVKHGFDAAGWGKYVQVWDSTQKLLINIAHASDLLAISGAYVRAGDQIAISGNTGNSDAPHVHVAAADTDDAGNRANLGSGLKGWYSILDGGRINLVPLSTGPLAAGDQANGPTVSPQSGGAVVPTTFDEIVPLYYIGWGREAAFEDFKKTYGGDVNRILTERGYFNPPAVKKPRPPELKKKYTVNPQYTGFSIKELVGPVLKSGRADLLAQFLSLSENEPLTKGQKLNPSGFPTDYYPGSGEWKGFIQLTSSTPIGVQGNYYIREQYAGNSLNDLIPKYAEGRKDITASFLGIPENLPITRIMGLGTSGFPPHYIPGSGEWKGFLTLFEQLPTAPGSPITEDIPEDDVDQAPPADGAEGAQQPTQYPTITIYSNPERAKIYIDELYFHDLTPSNKAYPTQPGKHSVRLEKSGYKDYVEEFEVTGTEQVVIRGTLEPYTPTEPGQPLPRGSAKKYTTTQLTRLVNELYQEVFHKAPEI